MRLDEFLDDFDRDLDAEKRRLAEEKSYAITDHLDTVETRFNDVLSDDTLVGSTSPEIFVGRSGYPNISTGVLSPVGDEEQAGEYATSGQWYDNGLGVSEVLQRRTGMLNSQGRANVTDAAVDDVWDGVVGAQREVAIADRPVGVEIGLDDSPEIDLTTDAVATPTGPNANAERVDLTENPYVPRAVKKTLEDDDWQAQGAMNYLWQRGFDVYEINSILSAGALGQSANRRLVPTRWSITAVDDTVGQFMHGQIRNSTSVDEVEVWYNEYVGNRYWVVLAPGQWEYELVEMKGPGSVWNPDEAEYFLASASEGYEGRTGYVDETAGAYYAARLGVLEELVERDRQAKVLVLREVTDEYWAPVGVWQVREAVRNAFGDGVMDRPATAETFHDAVQGVSSELPVQMEQLRRKSEMVAGVQSQLSAYE
ncbi:DNA repair protein NreA [Salinarchaeum laminariae]|uniref:DNA repair protein NreA n=1 Tax=Salinarchaeum laminariae TaxID=869888 RepID=UPI0020C0B075|nr:DNA repair protein NreA [Salinarchaeum laminariae]